MLAHLYTVVAYIVSTLLIQGTSHFAVNKAHYAAVSHIRTDPIVPLGVLSMVIQGLVLSVVFSSSSFRNGSLTSAVLFAWMFGAFLVSYMAFALAGEHRLPDISKWIVVEVSAGFLQFTLIGAGLWLAHRYG